MYYKNALKKIKFCTKLNVNKPYRKKENLPATVTTCYTVCAASLRQAGNGTKSHIFNKRISRISCIWASQSTQPLLWN